MTSPLHHPQDRTAKDPRLVALRDRFKQAGVTISAWAKANGFTRMAVVDVLRGKRVGRYGECHRVAVALGLKDGKVVDAATFDPSAPAVKATGRKGGR